MQKTKLFRKCRKDAKTKDAKEFLNYLNVSVILVFKLYLSIENNLDEVFLYVSIQEIAKISILKDDKHQRQFKF
jgi:hypothetical protein